MACAARLGACSPAGSRLQGGRPAVARLSPPSKVCRSAWLGSQKSVARWRRLHQRRLQLQLRGSWRPCARQADDSPPSEMTLETALELLGVREGASFDEILRAKKAILDTRGGTDQELIIQVETAYDILLMQSLSKRRAGKVVDSSIKFADVRQARPQAPQWLRAAAKASPVAVEAPDSKTLATQAALFGALAAWTLLGGLGGGSPGGQSGADIPGLQLALGFGAALYFLRQQSVKLGKASLLTVGGLVVGALLGNTAEAWLHVEIFPVLGVSSPAVLVSEFAFLALWLTSAYLR